MKNTTPPEQFQNIIEKWYKQWHDRYLEHTYYYKEQARGLYIVSNIHSDNIVIATKYFNEH